MERGWGNAEKAARTARGLGERRHCVGWMYGAEDREDRLVVVVMGRSGISVGSGLARLKTTRFSLVDDSRLQNH